MVGTGVGEKEADGKLREGDEEEPGEEPKLLSCSDL